ncbi:MAG: hypothetical protein ACR2P0_10570 [Acidimicrobiales bacterium]
MSGQMADVIVIDGEEWALVEPEPGKLFEPRDHDVFPVTVHSANTRGEFARYRLDEDRLLLADLQVGHDGAPAAINGVEATSDEHGKVWTYHTLDLPIVWSGDLVVGAEPILELYVHAGFAPAWHYARVLALDIEGGVVESREDRSEEVAEYRAAETPNDDPNAFERLMRAIRLRLPGFDG